MQAPPDSQFILPCGPPLTLFHLDCCLIVGFEFKRWLETCPHVKIDFTNFNTLQGEYPALPKHHFVHGASPEETPFHLYIVTGSHSGVYEELQWIRDLEAWIRQADELKAPLIGICFGHQVVASALGGKVTLNPKGWEVGAQTFALNEAGQALFKGKTTLHLQYSHQDAVVNIPACMQNLGGNEKTDCQGMCKGSHIFTLQGHPEFGKETMTGILGRKREKGLLSETEYTRAFTSLDEPVDANYVACASLAYLQLHPSLE